VIEGSDNTGHCSASASGHSASAASAADTSHQPPVSPPPNRAPHVHFRAASQSPSGAADPPAAGAVGSVRLVHAAVATDDCERCAAGGAPAPASSPRIFAPRTNSATSLSRVASSACQTAAPFQRPPHQQEHCFPIEELRVLAARLQVRLVSFSAMLLCEAMGSCVWCAGCSQ
jgi:hypothetical protein